MQTELLDRQPRRARDELKTAMFNFIEIFYNGQRLLLLSTAEQGKP